MSLIARFGRRSQKYLSPVFHRLGFIGVIESAYLCLLHLWTPDITRLTVGDHHFKLHTELASESRKVYHGLQTETDHLAAFLNELDSEDIVWDIGAHLGFWTCGVGSVLQDSNSIYAFEPLPANAKRLHENINLNDLSVTVYEVALSDNNGRTILSIPSDELGTTEGSLVVEKDDWIDLEISTRRGETVDAPAPTIMKIDVEGAEYSVLRGMGEKLSKCRLIFLELHPSSLPEDITGMKIRSYLSDKGFEIEQLSVRERDGTRMLRATRRTK